MAKNKASAANTTPVTPTDATEVNHIPVPPTADNPALAKLRAKAAEQAAKPLAKGKNRPTHPCACGCGKPTKGTWFPGCNGRLMGELVKEERAKLAAQPASATDQVQ